MPSQKFSRKRKYPKKSKNTRGKRQLKRKQLGGKPKKDKGQQEDTQNLKIKFKKTASDEDDISLEIPAGSINFTHQSQQTQQTQQTQPISFTSEDNNLIELIQLINDNYTQHNIIYNGNNYSEIEINGKEITATNQQQR